jgi:hypothetical protein
MTKLTEMATTNRMVFDHHWTPEGIKDLKHFAAIVKCWGIYDDLKDEEIVEAYEIITGRKAPEKKTTSKSKTK